MTGFLTRYARVLGVAAFAAAVLVLAGFMHWRVSQVMHETTIRRLAQALGAPDLTARDIQFVLLPSPRLKMKDLAFEQSVGIMAVRAADATVYVDTMTLLAGRSRPSGLALQAPDIRLRITSLGGSGFRDAGALTGLLGDAMAAQGPRLLIPRFDIDEGRLTLERGPNSPTLTYQNVRLRMRAPGIRHPVSFAFRGMAEGTETKVSFVGATPLRVVTGAREPLTFHWSTGHASLDFEGEGILSSTMMLKGTLQAAARGGLSALMAGQPGKPNSGPETKVSMWANLDYSSRGANLSDLRLTVNGNRFDGVGSLRHDGQRWHVSGTLASDRADLTPFLAPLGRLTMPDGRWSSAPIDIDSVFAHNIDVRLSAEQLGIYGRTLEKAAIAILTRPTKAELTLGDALWHKGSAKLRISAAPGSFGVDAKVTGSLDKADLGAALTDLSGSRRFTGSGGMNFALETSGRSVAQFVSNASGQAAAMVRSGDLVGIDLAKLVRRDGRRELALAEAMGGRTAFETAHASLKIANGAAQPLTGQLRAGRITATLGGLVDFSGGHQELSGAVVQLPAEGQVLEPLQLLEYTINGPLFEPRIAPNVSAMMRRS